MPPFADCLPCVASLPVRNRATVGGNIVNASPIGDFTIMLLALGATLGIRGPDGTGACGSCLWRTSSSATSGWT